MNAIGIGTHASTGPQPMVLFLDELPNAATAPYWIDSDGTVHAPLGDRGVAAMRALMDERLIIQDFGGLFGKPIAKPVIASGIAAVEASFRAGMIQKNT